MDDFREAINQAIYESKEKAINDIVDDFDFDSKISKDVKANLVSKIVYGMNLKSLDVQYFPISDEEVLTFKVALRRG